MVADFCHVAEIYYDVAKLPKQRAVSKWIGLLLTYLLPLLNKTVKEQLRMIMRAEMWKKRRCFVVWYRQGTKRHCKFYEMRHMPFPSFDFSTFCSFVKLYQICCLAGDLSWFRLWSVSKELLQTVSLFHFCPCHFKIIYLFFQSRKNQRIHKTCLAPHSFKIPFDFHTHIVNSWFTCAVYFQRSRIV